MYNNDHINQSSISFSPALPGEIDEVFALFCAATAELDRKGIPQWDELYPDREILCDDIDQQRLWLGRKAGSIVCAFALDSECDEQYTNGKWTRPDARFCVVHRLCVHLEYQHQGIGRLTMEHIEHLAAELGYDEIRLDTFSRNPYSIRLYENLGYRTVGMTHWRKGDFLLMEKSIVQQNEPEATDHENET